MHIIWDWNGTLFDDLHVVVESVNASLAAVGSAVQIDDEGYRDHYRRPVRDFYDVLLQRPVTDSEWKKINTVFHDVYFENIDQAGPNAEAHAAIAEGQSRRLTQSILSMWTHTLLEPTVSRHGLADAMLAVQGSTDGEGAIKAALLTDHLHRLSLGARAKVVMVGDTFDDAHAAVTAGVGAVFYDGGSHHRHALEATGVPVADTLCHAIDLAEAL
ncbi:MAG: HAD family hydrolase [Acidimicrobiia bacterium]|nr:HAD family hydrolase [Acidimicrobiia bacterium]